MRGLGKGEGEEQAPQAGESSTHKDMEAREHAACWRDGEWFPWLDGVGDHMGEVTD